MKTIGLLGGMSWESTLTYYQIINMVTAQTLGGLHSARCLLYSVDFDEIERCQQAGDWDRSARILADAAQALERGGADFLVICTNTMHKVAPQIAAAIERVRTDHPIETTLELVDIIRSAMPPSALREKQHPAKRSFQAIRIAVNDELGAVRQGMEAAIDHLNPGGRLVVITFHSLEDRIVKNVFQDAAKGCTCPPSFPVCVCGHKPKIKILTKKPIIATREEVEENPRSRSAKLRVAEHV